MPLLVDDGTARWLEHRGEVHRGTEGEVVRLRGTSLDVTERESATRKLACVAAHDALTGLSDRTAFHHHVRALVGRAAPGRVVVALVDSNHFKRFTRPHGWTAGDAPLREVAERLGTCVPELTMVARVDADGCALLLHDPPGELAAIGDQIAACMAELKRVDPSGQRAADRATGRCGRPPERRRVR